MIRALLLMAMQGIGAASGPAPPPAPAPAPAQIPAQIIVPYQAAPPPDRRPAVDDPYRQPPPPDQGSYAPRRAMPQVTDDERWSVEETVNSIDARPKPAVPAGDKKRRKPKRSAR